MHRLIDRYGWLLFVLLTIVTCIGLCGIVPIE